MTILEDVPELTRPASAVRGWVGQSQVVTPRNQPMPPTAIWHRLSSASTEGFQPVQCSARRVILLRVAGVCVSPVAPPSPLALARLLALPPLPPRPPFACHCHGRREGASRGVGVATVPGRYCGGTHSGRTESRGVRRLHPARNSTALGFGRIAPFAILGQGTGMHQIARTTVDVHTVEARYYTLAARGSSRRRRRAHSQDRVT